MQLPLAHLDGSVIEEVSLGLWRKLFQAVGWPKFLEGKKKDFTHEDVLQVFQDDPTDELLQALETLHELGTEPGREAIATAMKDRKVLPEMLQMDAGERELSLLLFIGQRTNAALAGVFERAQTQVQEGSNHRRYYEFMGREAQAISNLKSRQGKLLEETKRFCKEQDLGDHVQVKIVDGDGTYYFHVIRSHHLKQPLAQVPGRNARATIAYRPIHWDSLHYDSALGRLRISVRAASMVEYYRRTLGVVLFDDESFFQGDAICSLEVLQQDGRRALEGHSEPGIGRVRMTECIWERGDGALLQFRSIDCFRDFEELKLPIGEGRLLQAKLKLEVVGRSTRPVTVNIRVPSRIEISNKLHEQAVDQFLTGIGIRHRSGPSSGVDLWSLFPWRHPIEKWRSVFGAETDILIKQRVLVPIRLNTAPSTTQPGAGRVLNAAPLEGGDFFGVSSEPEIPSQTLSATDLDGFELVPLQLRKYLQGQYGLTGTPLQLEGNDLLDLGELEVGTFRFRLIYALRRPQSGFGERIRAKWPTIYQVLLLPTSVEEVSELPKVILGEAAPSVEKVVRGVIAACWLEKSVPAIFTSPPGSRLVVDTNRGMVWVDRVAIPGLKQGTQPFRFVEALARACPRAVSHEELTQGLSQAREDGGTTARVAKTDARRCINEAMAAAGLKLELDPFMSVPTGLYRCTLQAYVV